MMVFDEWHNGVSIAYIITSRYKTCDLSTWMDVLNKSLLFVNANWHPNAFIINDARAEINNLRYMMTRSLLLVIHGF
jgi:hypothetical protein